jgi:hypothetical protein
MAHSNSTQSSHASAACCVVGALLFPGVAIGLFFLPVTQLGWLLAVLCARHSWCSLVILTTGKPPRSCFELSADLTRGLLATRQRDR